MPPLLVVIAYTLAAGIACTIVQTLFPQPGPSHLLPSLPPAPNAPILPKKTSLRGNLAALLACICLFTAFSCIPPGSLPALIAWKYADAALLGLLLFTALLPAALFRVTGQAPSTSIFFRSRLASVMVLACSHTLLAWYVSHRGVPGAAWQLDTYVNMPLWQIMALPGRCGLVCLAVALAALAPQRSFYGNRAAKLSETATVLLWHAMAVCLVFPLNTAPYTTFFSAAFFDFCFFWCKVMAAAFFLSPWLAARLRRTGALMLLLTASVLIIFDGM